MPLHRVFQQKTPAQSCSRGQGKLGGNVRCLIYLSRSCPAVEPLTVVIDERELYIAA